jgi:hypothetical protein
VIGALPAEYQIREWDAQGGLVRELVSRDANAAHGMFEPAASPIRELA